MVVKLLGLFQNNCGPAGNHLIRKVKRQAGCKDVEIHGVFCFIVR